MSLIDPGCVKTLRGIPAPRILRLVVTLRAKKCEIRALCNAIGGFWPKEESSQLVASERAFGGTPDQNCRAGRTVGNVENDPQRPFPEEWSCNGHNSRFTPP
jgi:hypothetical protein